MMERLQKFVEHNYFQRFVLILIIANAFTIGMETSPNIMKNYGTELHYVDQFILGVFALELLLKLVVYRFSFFKDPWNIFDFVIVVVALLPTAGPLQILRTLRILRTARLIKNVPKLRLIIESLIKSIPSIGWIAVLLAMIFYVFAVIGTDLYQDDFPEYFGNMGITFFTLFQIMTLESWSSGIARPMMEVIPNAYVFFVPFILLATYTTLNVFIAIVVNTMNEIHRAEVFDEEERERQSIHDEHHQILDYLAKLEKQVSDLQKKLDDNTSKVN